MIWDGLAHGWLGATLAIVISVVLTPLCGRWLGGMGLYDASEEARKVHQGKVPLSGGLSVFFALVLVILIEYTPSKAYFLAHPMLFIGGSLIFLLGLWDDFAELGAKTRLIAQFVIAGLVVYWEGLSIAHLGMPLGVDRGYVGTWVLGEPMSVLAIVLMINAVNMLDGLDGLLAGLMVIAFSGLLYLGLTDGMDLFLIHSIVLLICALLGFLVWNYRGFGNTQAGYFLGDSGSMFLGFMLAYFAINTAMDPHSSPQMLVPPITVAWVVALPAAELLTMFVKRLIRGAHPMNADRTHLHHLLLRGGFSKFQAVLFIHSMMLVLVVWGAALWRLGVSESVQFVQLGVFFVGYGFISYYADKIARLLRSADTKRSDQH